MGASGTVDGDARYSSSVDLVLAGGGVKGIAHVGALRALHEAGYVNYPRIAGTSVGSLVGAMLAYGHSLTYISDELHEFPFAELGDRSAVAGVPILGTPAALFKNYGLCKGDRLVTELERHLHDITFAELKAEWVKRQKKLGLPTDVDYPFVALATDITRGELVQFPRDLPKYGMTEETTRVVDVVRASASVPLFFEPARFGKSLLVDGGVLANFATDIFDREAASVVHEGGTTTIEYASRWPTFGISLLSHDKAETVGINLIGGVTGNFVAKHLGLVGLGRFSQGLIGTLVAGQDSNAATNPLYARRTIRVDTHETGIVDFGLAPSVRNQLDENGFATMDAFLRGAWSDGSSGEPGFGFDGRKYFRLPTPLRGTT